MRAPSDHFWSPGNFDCRRSVFLLSLISVRFSTKVIFARDAEKSEIWARITLTCYTANGRVFKRKMHKPLYSQKFELDLDLFWENKITCFSHKTKGLRKEYVVNIAPLLRYTL